MNKLNADKCREQFEEWGKPQRCELDKWVRGDRAGEYKNPVVAKMWQAWEASRDALPIPEQQERGEGEWIEWVGGPMPVSDKSWVDIKWIDGYFSYNTFAAIWDWEHRSGADNIIAYRIIPERATNQNGEQ